ncbi:Ribosomal protein S18 acetylase RimI [Pseudomonas japonica]|uniref:Ribosomal protein S18 acetylase RimI n=1 Tax=Pseudomonas japonica TaxID=256466 RepID=A0A239EJK5_9PSED|nr:Ribosomal protein S18 acetylase RimI [Pseudomonas japonica]
MSFDFRVASTADIAPLAALEQECFTFDRLRARNFHWLLGRGNASLIVAVRDGQLAGYALLLFRRRTSLARLYSIAVHPRWRGHGLGPRLLRAAEAGALARDCRGLRLEVRADNPAAIGLYEAHGYRRFAVVEDYYEDHAQALRYEKTILSQAPAPSPCSGCARR